MEEDEAEVSGVGITGKCIPGRKRSSVKQHIGQCKSRLQVRFPSGNPAGFPRKFLPEAGFLVSRVPGLC
ncbi:hypothetical protein KSP39_PZI010309 [Platanthera zijinensis]|uniref:Uncharacterized protein n=1 Tax=Platanthera zijinensis TaxID=2320716 RepID=A0AAP0BK74_9ASPA